MAHAVRPERHRERSGQPLRRGHGECLGGLVGVRSLARRLSRERQAGAGACERRVGARLARRARHRRHGAQHDRPCDEAGRLRGARRLRQRHAVLATTTASRRRGRCRSSSGKTLPYAVCGYTPDQLRGAYGVNGLGNTQNLGRGPDRGDHRRVRRADAAGRREHVCDAPRRPAVRTRSVPGPQRARGRIDGRRLRRQRLVRRADARRRSRSCNGSRCERPLLRRRELLRRRLPRAAVADRARQQGVDRHQLVGRARPSSSSTASSRTSARRRDRRGVRDRLQAGRRSGDRLQLLLGRQRRRARALGLRPSGLSGGRPLGHRGRRHLARRRQAQQARVRDGLGHGEVQPLAPTATAGRSALPFLVRRGRRYQPGLRRALRTSAASCGTRERPRGARRRHGRGPDDGHARRRDAELLAARARSGRQASTTASTASAARASPRRSSPARRRSLRPTRADGGSVSPTRSSTPSRASRASSTT